MISGSVAETISRFRTQDVAIAMTTSAPFKRALTLAPPVTEPFDRAFREHAPRVARWAARLGGPTIDCDEVVQDVFVVVERRLAEFRGDGKLTTWLFRITAKIVANHHRAARRRRLWASLTRRIEDETPSADDLPGDALEKRESTRRFYEVMNVLPQKYREVLTLFELEEMSTEDIGRLLDTPPATIRVWLHRARQAFVTAWRRRQREDERESI